MRLKSRAINVRSLAHRDRKRDGSEHGSSSKNSSSSSSSEEEEEESEDEAEPSIRFFDRCAKGRGRFLYAVPMNKKVPPVRFLHEVERELLAMSNAVTAVAQRRRHNLEFRELKQRDHVMAVVAGNPRTLALLRRFQIRYIFRYVCLHLSVRGVRLGSHLRTCISTHTSLSLAVLLSSLSPSLRSLLSIRLMKLLARKRKETSAASVAGAVKSVMLKEGYQRERINKLLREQCTRWRSRRFYRELRRPPPP